LRPDVLGMLRILTNFDMDSRLVLSLVIAGQPPLRSLLARDDQEAMARRIVHYAQLRLLSREELAQYVAHRCTVAGATRVPFDDRTLDALFEIGRGNLRATDDLALKSLDYAAAAGHATVSVQHVVGARKDLWP
jgi:general secretion pathway protein A